MTKKIHFSGSCLFCIAILLFAIGNSTWAESVPREAQKHMNRGMAAAEMAKSPAEYEEAIREFEKAVRLAPGWPAPYFNLGYVQNEAGNYEEALNNYRKYLKLVPNAPDAEQVQKEIDQIEYRLEKVSEAAKIRGWLEGEWGSVETGPFLVRFIVNGDSVNMYYPTTLKTFDRVSMADYETILIKQEGRKIQFGVVQKLKTKDRSGGAWYVLWEANTQFNLNLIAPNKMEGTFVYIRKAGHSGEIVYKSEGKASFSKER